MGEEGWGAGMGRAVGGGSRGVWKGLLNEKLHMDQALGSAVLNDQLTLMRCAIDWLCCKTVLTKVVLKRVVESAITRALEAAACPGHGTAISILSPAILLGACPCRHGIQLWPHFPSAAAAAVGGHGAEGTLGHF